MKLQEFCKRWSLNPKAWIHKLGQHFLVTDHIVPRQNNIWGEKKSTHSAVCGEKIQKYFATSLDYEIFVEFNRCLIWYNYTNPGIQLEYNIFFVLQSCEFLFATRNEKICSENMEADMGN